MTERGGGLRQSASCSRGAAPSFLFFFPFKPFFKFFNFFCFHFLCLTYSLFFCLSNGRLTPTSPPTSPQTLHSWAGEEFSGRGSTAASVPSEGSQEERCKQVEPPTTPETPRTHCPSIPPSVPPAVRPSVPLSAALRGFLTAERLFEAAAGGFSIPLDETYTAVKPQKRSLRLTLFSFSVVFVHEPALERQGSVIWETNSVQVLQVFSPAH